MEQLFILHKMVAQTRIFALYTQCCYTSSFGPGFNFVRLNYYFVLYCYY